jgi:Superinfection immunity protein
VELLTLLLVLLAAILYFIPTGIANQRRVKNRGSIIFINIVFGWTVLGWIAALLWAIMEAPEEPVTTAPVPAPHRSQDDLFTIIGERMNRWKHKA